MCEHMYPRGCGGLEGEGRSQEPECEQGAALSRDVREIVCVQVCVGVSIVGTAHAKAWGGARLV